MIVRPSQAKVEYALMAATFNGILYKHPVSLKQHPFHRVW